MLESKIRSTIWESFFSGLGTYTHEGCNFFHLKLVDHESLGNLFFKTDIQCV